MQFNQPDTIIPNPYYPGSFNRYSYSFNNPVKYTDPSGFCAVQEQPIRGGKGIELIPDLNSDKECWDQYYALTKYMEDWDYDRLLILGDGADWVFITDLELDYWELIDEYEEVKNQYSQQFNDFTDYYQAYIFHAILTGNPALALSQHVQVIDSNVSEVDSILNEVWGKAATYAEYALGEGFLPIPLSYYEDAIKVYEQADYALSVRLRSEASIAYGYSNPNVPGGTEAGPTSPLASFFERLFEVFFGDK